MSAALLVFSCTSFPEIRPLEKMRRSDAVLRCTSVYPRKSFRAVHTIDASMPMGKSSSMMGASQVDTKRRTLRAVLVSIEGLTLFDATSTRGVLRVHRAIAPFDDMDFARGLINDVSLVLLAPAGKLEKLGEDSHGRLVCRYAGADGSRLDLIPAVGSSSTLVRVYDPDAVLVRTAEFFDASGPLGLAKKVVLRAPGLVGYELSLSLLGAEPISFHDFATTPMSEN